MAEDVIDTAISRGKLSPRPCVTEHLPLHGWTKKNIDDDHWSVYGNQQKCLKLLMKKNPAWAKRLHPRLPYFLAEVIWAVREEMAQNIEDVLARRTRALFLDAKASIECAPIVAHLMAKELKKSPSWEKKQVLSYTRLAKGYLP
jgi:glycerol-3-phosphate dehydrogenase